MSDVNLDFTVSNNSIDFTVESNDITITPTDIQLTFYNSAPPTTGGGNGQVQYNNFGQLGGIPSANYSGGNLTFQIANTKITGGTNHYYLQTDGTGNLTWAEGTGNMQGNGTVGGANTQIQFNDGGMDFGGNAGFTFDRTTGNVDIPGNLIVVGNIFGNIANANYANYAGNVTISNQPNITNVGNLTSLTVSGNANITGTLTVAGTSSIQAAKEKVTLDGAPSSTLDFNLLNQAIIYNVANATNDFIINFRGNSGITLNSIMSNGESITCAYLNTNGTTGYYLTSVTIDGTSVTPKWVYPTGAPAIGISNGVDIYNFNIIKTNTSTYTVIASRIGYQ